MRLMLIAVLLCACGPKNFETLQPAAGCSSFATVTGVVHTRSNDPVVSHALTVSVGGKTTRATTDATGRFQVAAASYDKDGPDPLEDADIAVIDFEIDRLDVQPATCGTPAHVKVVVR